MAQVIPRSRMMYWSPTRRRHYASLRQACLAEAGAQISRKYPSEEIGWHWTNEDRMRIVQSRLARRIEHAARRAAQTEGGADDHG